MLLKFHNVIPNQPVAGRQREVDGMGRLRLQRILDLVYTSDQRFKTQIVTVRWNNRNLAQIRFLGVSYQQGKRHPEDLGCLIDGLQVL